MTKVGESFYTHFTPTSWTACWLWHGHINNAGYGMGWDRIQRRSRPAHCLAFELAFNKRIPPKIQIDHLCKVRSCVNPLHLEAVTSFVNNHRSDAYIWNTECLRGHKFTKENTYIRLDKGTQECRACRRDARAAFKRRTGK